MEPERRIEKVLRAYAKKRRDQAGALPELHPATRRLLHGEIARRAPGRAGGGFFPRLLARLRSRLVFVSCAGAAAILLAALLFMPALGKAKLKSTNMIAANNLRQIGAAVGIFASENKRLPVSLDEIKGQLATEKTLIDPESGKQFVYVGGEKLARAAANSEVLAYSPVDNQGRLVLFADGSVSKVSSSRFAELADRSLSEIASSYESRRAASADALTPPATSPMREELASVQTRTKNDDGKTRADTDALSLQDRRPEVATVDQERSHLSAAVTATGATVVAGNAGQKFKNGTPGEMIPDSIGGTVAPTNEGLIAINEPPDFVATKGNQAQSEIPKSEPTGAFDVAANAPQAPGVGEMKSSLSDLQKSDAAAGPSAMVVSQQYAQAGELANAQYVAKKISSPVLASFQMQQNDQSIRVVDQDGSVYNGYWGPGDAPGQNQKELAKVMSAPPPAASEGFREGDMRDYKDNQSGAQNYFFQVTGTNQSLKQNVVFTGNFTALTNGVLLVQKNAVFYDGAGGNDAAKGIQNQAGNQALQLLLSNSRISGTAILDNNKEIQINALPTQAPR